MVEKALSTGLNFPSLGDQFSWLGDINVAQSFDVIDYVGQCPIVLVRKRGDCSESFWIQSASTMYTCSK